MIADLSEREELVDEIREWVWILGHESMAAAFKLGEPGVGDGVNEC